MSLPPILYTRINYSSKVQSADIKGVASKPKFGHDPIFNLPVEEVVQTLVMSGGITWAGVQGLFTSILEKYRKLVVAAKTRGGNEQSDGD